MTGEGIKCLWAYYLSVESSVLCINGMLEEALS